MGKKKRCPRSRRWFEELVTKDPCVLTPALLDAMTTKEIGDFGEALAANYLFERGYEIVEFSYRCLEGEADLIAWDPFEEQVVLVEVKTRRLSTHAYQLYPEEAVTPRKQKIYRRIAALYALERFPVPSIRFDVIAVELTPGCIPDFTHLEGAFDWDAGL